jgi:undecaprenyl-diphosphatase
MPTADPVAPATRSPWLLAVANVLVFGVLALLVTTGITDAFDLAIAELVRTPEVRPVLAPLRQATELGSTWAVTAVAIALLVGGTLARRPRDAIVGAAIIALGAATVEIVKAIVARARPELLEPILIETGFSFPSGHSANAMVAYGIVAVLVGRTSLARPTRVAAQVALAGVIGLVGLSRVWIGVHHPTDVVAGWAIGAVAVCAYVAITRSAWPVPVEAVAPEDPAGRRSDPPAAE